MWPCNKNIKIQIVSCSRQNYYIFIINNRIYWYIQPSKQMLLWGTEVRASGRLLAVQFTLQLYCHSATVFLWIVLTKWISCNTFADRKILSTFEISAFAKVHHCLSVEAKNGLKITVTYFRYCSCSNNSKSLSYCIWGRRAPSHLDINVENFTHSLDTIVSSLDPNIKTHIIEDFNINLLHYNNSVAIENFLNQIISKNSFSV